MNPTERNQKIIDAIVEKAAALCPGSLALIGIYGSFLTGDVHAKSDLDLLIVINDELGYRLGAAFIQDDAQIGHDLYCTTWDSLRSDAQYGHPHIAKLMDSRIVWCADEKYISELEVLRAQTHAILSAPLSQQDIAKAEHQLREAEHCCMDTLTSDSRQDVLNGAGGVIYYVENAIALLNKRYFRRGVRRAYEELNAMPLRPPTLTDRIEAIVSAESIADVRQNALMLVRDVRDCLSEVRRTLPSAKNEPTADVLRGTYEEMFSNWRNKMHLAAETNDRHLSFMSLVSLNAMLADIVSGMELGSFDVMNAYDPQDLSKAAEAFDGILNRYLQLYGKAGLTEARYADADAFLREYKG